jgi:hypothetical protein
MHETTDGSKLTENNFCCFGVGGMLETHLADNINKGIRLGDSHLSFLVLLVASVDLRAILFQIRA